MLEIHAQFLCRKELKEKLLLTLPIVESINSNLVFYEIMNHQINIDRTKRIIFLSNDDQDVFNSLVYQPLYFIRINHFDQDITQVALLLQYQNQEMIRYKINGIQMDIPVSTILYIESYGHYITIHTSTKSYKVRENISAIIQKLPDYFKRIHKSYIVNSKKITHRSAHELTINHTIQLPLGRSYKE